MLPYRSASDRIEGAILTFVEITERRRAEERLKAGEERMRLVAESTRDYAILTTDESGHVTSWNHGATRIFGYTEAEMLGQGADLVFTPEDLARGVPDDERRRARLHGRAEDERWHQRKDGSRFFCSGVATPLYNNGALVGYAKIARDITEQKYREQERDAEVHRDRNDLAEARAANALKDEFLAVLSHELKHPLNLIQLNAELLARVAEVRASDVARRATEVIGHAALNQGRIIDDLLDMSRLHTGKLKLERAALDCVALVRTIASVLDDDPIGTQRTIRFDAHATEAVVWGDRTRIEQVVWNLVSNAIKYSPVGSEIALRVGVDGEFVRIDVADQGRGIPPEFMPRLFRMFSQVERYTTRREGGLGIGLALSKQLAELHGGHIEVASEGTGRGATFTLVLPRAEAITAPPRVVRGDGLRLTGLRLLLVDDSIEGLDTLRQLLELEGAIVMAAISGLMALSLLEDTPVDAILSDIAMPDMDGYEFMRAVRRLDACRATPTVALTGFGRRVDVEHALEAGFDVHLCKPVTLESLVDALARVMRERGQA